MVFGRLVETFEKKASEPACGERRKRKSAGQAGKGDATRPKRNKKMVSVGVCTWPPKVELLQPHLCCLLKGLSLFRNLKSES